MRPSRAVAGALGLALGVLAGCGLVRKVPPVRYYTLAVTAPPAARLAGPVRVGIFTADQPYATERIAYRSSRYRLDYYTYHRWAADPRNLLRDAIRDYLEAAATAGSGPPLEVEGHIRRLEEVDDADGWSAALTLDLKITRGGAILLERSYTETEPAADRRPEAVAAALSRALQRILDHALADLPASGR
jgi:ABC-type uncharacterized transport system auxiliary subunit